MDNDNFFDYDEMMEEKKARRQALMSDKEIELTEQYLLWYRRGYEDKQRLGLIEKWRDVEKYWEGEFEYDDENDPAPNTNITNSNVEGKTALLCDQTIAIQVDPREPGDRPFCNMARTLADFIKERNKMYRKIEVHERRREMFGTGIFRVLWDFDKLDGKGMPDIEPIHPDRIIVDPAITDVYDIQEAQYIIEAKSKSLYSAYAEYGDEIGDAIIPNYDPVQNLIQENDEDQYVHMMVWTRYKENGKRKLRLVEMSGDGVLLRDTKKEIAKYNKEGEKEEEEKLFKGEIKEKSKEELELFPNDKFPYFFTPDMHRENTVWGKASAELILPISDQIDEIDDSTLRNARLTGNPMGLVSNSSGIDPAKITNEAGQMIPTNDINGFKWQSPPSMPNYILNRRTELMNQDRQIVSRFSDQMIGKQVEGVSTATESLALQNSGNSMIEHKKGLLQETLSEVFEYALELALINWNTTMVFRITGDKGEDDFVEFNPDRLNNIPLLIESDTEYREEYKKKWQERNKGKSLEELNPSEYKYMQVDNETRKIQYDLSVSVGAGLPNNRAYRYSIVRQMYVDKALTRREYRNYMIKSIGMNIPEIPETEAEQQEVQIFDEEKLQEMQQQAIQQQNQSANIEGLTANGNPSLKQVQGGLLNA